MLITIGLGILFVIILGFLFILIMRFYHDVKYRSQRMDNIPAYYANPNELSLYKTDVAGLTIEHVTGDYLNGFKMIPNDIKHRGVVVTFGGSDGTPAYEQAVQLAKEGYQVLALFFFGMPNQQKTLARVPVEYYQEIESYISQHFNQPDVITLIGTSKGAEYALLLASLYDSIDNVVLYAPSSYVYAGLDFKDYSSSWSQNGEALPYLDVRSESSLKLFYDFLVKAPISYYNTYKQIIKKDKDSEEKRIKAEKTKANFLIFAGEKDAMWPSAESARLIAKYHPEHTQIAIYKEAGHLFAGSGIVGSQGVYLSVGGNKMANEAAKKDSDQKLKEHLKIWHG
ncbi:acyl-CoA thioester hydrolase/BAAT C-terminal domain-containing protein [Streptococcus macacae]|uniref:BAAT/acyl-CoA thioester hydrolase C-terminal domain protein n=1 Tax=Streptococcus macacae NCTC 11558 TaxID=764298 RepID=G5JYC3_9STRE|nr:acyl-CoA thioester hydrolase/BAAT C-terminal domain-containing protein [Streptococcus macacae]EHJ52653.1 BAAT/acyl-CoA thioester hydrolase C-terminal domain protein [Streptococcus macacae NCTC 11558]SUN78037.1 acyl-CoA thioesterase [Streptococcus macacae NCTC 11558]